MPLHYIYIISHEPIKPKTLGSAVSLVPSIVSLLHWLHLLHERQAPYSYSPSLLLSLSNKAWYYNVSFPTLLKTNLLTFVLNKFLTFYYNCPVLFVHHIDLLIYMYMYLYVSICIHIYICIYICIYMYILPELLNALSIHYLKNDLKPYLVAHAYNPSFCGSGYSIRQKLRFAWTTERIQEQPGQLTETVIEQEEGKRCGWGNRSVLFTVEHMCSVYKILSSIPSITKFYFRYLKIGLQGRTYHCNRLQGQRPLKESTSTAS